MQLFLILLEFDFKIVVKKGIIRHLSRLINGEAPVGVPDDLPDAYLFNVEMVPKWSKDIIPMLTVGNIPLSTSKEASLSFIEQSQRYAMVVGRLYWKEDGDLLMKLCIDKEAAILYLEYAHVAIGNMHLSPNQTMKRIKRMGFYWPTMYKDVHEHIRECTC